MRIRMRPDRCVLPKASACLRRSCPRQCVRRPGSMPWSTALRIRCVSGSPSRSITVLSSSVLSPDTSSRTCLPVDDASSRRMRGTRTEHRSDRLRADRHGGYPECRGVSPSITASSSVTAIPAPESRCATMGLCNHQFAPRRRSACRACPVRCGSTGRGRAALAGPMNHQP